MVSGIKQLLIDILTAYNELGDWWLNEVIENSKIYKKTERDEVENHWVDVQKWCKDVIQRLKSKGFNFTEKDSAMWADMCKDSNFCDGVMQDYLTHTLGKEEEEVSKAEEIVNVSRTSVKAYLKALRDLESHADLQNQQDITEI
jgi:hypothetical protein